MKLTTKGTRLKQLNDFTHSLHLPMRRNFPQPLHSRILHWHSRIKPLSNSMTNESSPLLLQKLDESLFLLIRKLILPFHVEEDRNCPLFLRRGYLYLNILAMTPFISFGLISCLTNQEVTLFKAYRKYCISLLGTFESKVPHTFVQLNFPCL